MTVDDENIEFLSGIDVGVDFSDYEPGITETDADAIVTGDAAETDEFNSIGAALDQKGADTTVLVKSDYDASNENSNNDGSNSALISIVHKNVEVISQEGPTKTVIDERPDATGGGRAVDINAANVVFKGFDVSNAAQEGIVVTGVENAKGIEITDNKVTSDTDGILVSEYGPEGFDSASTDGIVIENNEINHKRFGVSLSNGATEPVVKHNTIIGNGNERGIALNRDGEGVTNATVEANLVETSYVGFQRNDDGSTVESLSNNHFINNDLLAIANSASGQLDATENFFGTEDRQTIQDEKISGSGGDTVFDPFAAVEIDPDAGK
ncbi:right-handed parallel beta-helix repeat-containing protein [Halorubrum sp. 2020YC2]|uniref:right-handed parallel beta-helix repeat-containing protein n=1 Tax=Halorubrum sp. 2020YC2 TaxID=2836432 RepID=UPI001BE86F23|nr:right-handed parallel beta-helix repeat-containing protein [Halorubrum sp. 2020YC2]QWC18723.1 right-handed parallel beta-helix repeat-containing protein [Halorubrum sp. 2020YC2]